MLDIKRIKEDLKSHIKNQDPDDLWNELMEQLDTDNEAKQSSDDSGYKEYSAWCHDCSRSFVHYHTLMDKPDYECPLCNSDQHVTVP